MNKKIRSDKFDISFSYLCAVFSKTAKMWVPSLAIFIRRVRAESTLGTTVLNNCESQEGQLKNNTQLHITLSLSGRSKKITTFLF